MNLSEYKLVWEDDFNYEGRLDSTKWNYETGNHQWPNRELQAYTDRPENVSASNGVLTIRSLKQQDGEREYTSGKINTRGKASWQYGYFEFKVKIAKGLGSWPAICLQSSLPMEPPPPVTRTTFPFRESSTSSILI